MTNCAIVGATGLVGRTFLKVLEEKKLPIDNYVLLASSNSKGKKIKFMDKEYKVEELTKGSFNNNRFTYALFSAGGDIAKEYIPIAVANNCRVIDNSSFFRMHDEVPLIVPQVNFEKIKESDYIIANPNCSTVQLVIPLKILNEKYKIKRVVVSTYQAVSGAGMKAVADFENHTTNKFIYKINDNCLPHIDVFLENDYTKEEMKMIEETRKILDLPDLQITTTAVRVPVKNCHCESVNVEFENEFDIAELKQTLNLAESVVVQDDVSKNIYPIPEQVDEKDEVYVGRIRRDYSVKNGINFWCVADNIRKGAASNAVEILERLLSKN